MGMMLVQGIALVSVRDLYSMALLQDAWVLLENIGRNEAMMGAFDQRPFD